MLAFLLVFVGMVAAGVWMDSSLHRIPALADYPARPATGKGTTWLLVGSESAYGALTGLYYEQIEVELTPVSSERH